MKIVNSKLLLHEEEVVEYSSRYEYWDDLDRRRKEGWVREKIPSEEYVDVVTKYNNGKTIQRYKRCENPSK